MNLSGVRSSRSARVGLALRMYERLMRYHRERRPCGAFAWRLGARIAVMELGEQRAYYEGVMKHRAALAAQWRDGPTSGDLPLDPP